MSSCINIEMILEIMIVNEGRRMEKEEYRDEWLSVGHTFTFNEREVEKETLKEK